MSLSSRVRTWWRAVRHGADVDAQVDEELRFHIESFAEDLARSGLSRDEAIRRAKAELGSVAARKEDCRAAWGTRWFDELRGDLQYAVRKLAKSPGFAAVAIGSLALGIGANTTIFTIARQVLLDKLDVHRPEELRLFAWTGGKNRVPVRIWGHWNETTHTCTSFSYPVYQQLRRQNSAFEDVFAFKAIPQVTVTVANKPEPVTAELVSGNYYSALGVNTVLGRGIQNADEGAPGSSPVAVISDGFWSRHFGRSPDVIGKTMQVNLTPVTIVGVNPREFTGASSVQISPDVFLPFSMEPVAAPNGAKSLLTNLEQWWVLVMGRIKPGVSDESARAAMDVLLSNAVRSTMTVEKSQSVPHFAMQDGSRGEDLNGEQFTKSIYVLMALAGVVLLLACANLANLLLARARSRQRELSVRLALGAKPGRILRQMLTESLLLSTAGGIAGLLLAFCGRNAIPHLMSSSWESTMHVLFDWKIFGFTAAVSLLTGLLFGFVPAWQAMHTQVSGGLKENAHSVMQGRGNFSGRMLVTFQIALSMLLLVGAGLFIRTVTNLNQAHLGFRPDSLVLFEIQAPNTRYPGSKEIVLYRQIEQHLASTPGVNSVSLSKNPLIAGNVSNDDFVPDGLPPKLNGKAYVDDNVVGQDFFSTMGIPILAGRSFDGTDTETSRLVAVVNQQLVKEYFQNTNPIGRTFWSNKKHIEIIGVSGDTRYATLRDDPPATFYTLYRQQSKSEPSMTFEISSNIKPSALVPALRETAASVDKDLPLLNIRTQNAQIRDRTRQERIFASLTSGFGLLALILACIGIYGVMAYSVSQRTREIGIRMALGAEPERLLRMVLGEATWVVALGILAGVCGALALSRVIASMLYGLKAWDPVTFAGSAAMLMMVALGASWIPASRAARVDPMCALRHE